MIIKTFGGTSSFAAKLKLINMATHDMMNIFICDARKNKLMLTKKEGTQGLGKLFYSGCLWKGTSEYGDAQSKLSNENMMMGPWSGNDGDSSVQNQYDHYVIHLEIYDVEEMRWRT